MILRHLAAVVTVGAVASGVPSLAQAQHDTAGAWTAITADGHPDLQGVWDYGTITPLERPAEFAGKAVLTDEEVAELEQRAANRTIDRAPWRWCADAGRPTRFKPSSPSPPDAVRDGSAKLGHPVQNVTREYGLTPLPR